MPGAGCCGGNPGAAKLCVHPDLFPGEGRGPVGKASVETREDRFLDLRNWTPAFAGEQLLPIRVHPH